MNKTKFSILLLALFAIGQMTYAQSSLNGSGTKDNPYRIESNTDWQYFCNNDIYAHSFVKLTNNISTSSMVEYTFEGTFDGNGHTLTLNVTDNNQDAVFFGPFKHLSDATILNLHTAGTMTIKGRYAGGIAGEVINDTYINNCHSSMTIVCNFSGDGGCGGFVGHSPAVTPDGNYVPTEHDIHFQNCLFDGTFSGSAFGWGGFVGDYYYIGGMGGHSGRVYINNCLYAGNSTAVNNQGACNFVRFYGWVLTDGQGGVGHYDVNNSNYAEANVARTGRLFYKSICGTGLATGYSDTHDATGMSNTELCAGLGEGWEIVNNQVVPVTVHYPTNGDGTAESPYLIENEQDWIDLSRNVNLCGETFVDKFFRLDADISVSKMVGSSDDRSFRGVFDGNGHTLNVTINDGEGAAPFRYICNATIKNLHVTGSVTGTGDCAGGLVGLVKDNSSNTLQNCRVSADVTVRTRGGGIIGNARSSSTTLTGCAFDGTITNTADGVSDNNRSVGGLVGWCSNYTANWYPYPTYYPYLSFVDCYFGGTYHAGTSAVEFHPIAVKDSGAHPSCNVSNCYYIETAIPDIDNDGQYNIVTDDAKMRHNIVGGQYVTVAINGSYTYYNTSRLTAYAAGLAIRNQFDTDVLYAGMGDVLSLTLTVPLECSITYFRVSAGTLEGTENPYTLTMPIANEDVIISLDYDKVSWKGQGTQLSPYLIENAAQFDLLAIRQSQNESPIYNGVYFKLMADITVYNMVGEDTDHAFSGIFDGNGHTINAILDSDQQGVALFHYIDGATIKNLHVTGTVTGSALHAGGLVGFCNESSSNTIENCRVSTTLNVYDLGGGIVGHSRTSTLNMTGCVFDGIINNTATSVGDLYHAVGGLVGWCDGGTLNFTDCLYDGLYIINTSNVAFHPIAIKHHSYTPACTLSNTYYKNEILFPAVVGSIVTNAAKLTHSITALEGVAIANTGTPANEYNVSNITGYGIGIKYDNVLYAGQGESISLSLGAAGGYSLTTGFTTEPTGILSGATSPYTLTMPNQDVTISAEWYVNDWENEGRSGDTWEDAYLIYNKGQLSTLASRVNGGKSYSGKYFKLMEDLTYDYASLNPLESNYDAIGNYTNHFNGHFDGQGHTLSGLRIYRVGNEDVIYQYKGVFGYIGTDGEVKNLTLNDANITAGDYTGGIVGYIDEGAITNCHVTSSVTIGSDWNPGTPGKFVVDHGGIAGAIRNSTLSDCTSAATLTHTGNSTPQGYGGIVGDAYISCSITDNIAIGVVVPAANTCHGAILGLKSSSVTLERNYYVNCTVAGDVNTTTKGSNNTNVVANDGAVPAFILTLSDDITASPGASVSYQETYYYAMGTSITLSGGTDAPTSYGYENKYVVNGTPINGNSFNMPGEDASVIVETLAVDWEVGRDGSAEQPYLIYVDGQWDLLATRVNAGNNYSGKHFMLMDDIIINTMVGNSKTNSFQGIFDGDGHTLTLYGGDFGTSYLATNVEGCAPFRFVSGATIKNLKVDGDIYTSNQRAAGLIAIAGHGDNLIENCLVSVHIHSKKNGEGDHGGIIALLQGHNGQYCTTTFKGCAFTGSITTTNLTTSVGGFVGWSEWRNDADTEKGYCTLVINDCFVAPNEDGVTSGSKTFARCSSDEHLTIANGYYNQTIGDAQGKRARTYGTSSEITMSQVGDAIDYTVSGITGGYNYGIKYNDVPCAGLGDNVGLLITPVEAKTIASVAYTPDGGSSSTELDHVDGVYYLNMPDANVTLSAILVIWNGTGTEADPFVISTIEEWTAFTETIDQGASFGGKFFKLGDNVGPVTTMAGTTSHPFGGSFDGKGNTLTVAIEVPTAKQGVAPFHYIGGATLKNLVVEGTVTVGSENLHAAGLVGFAWRGSNTIENCLVRSNVTSGSNYAGGIVGHGTSATLTIRDCEYSGTLSVVGDNYTGGLLGWCDHAATITLSNSIFSGAYSNNNAEGKFHPVGCSNRPLECTRNFSSIYYTVDPIVMLDDDDKSLVKGLANYLALRREVEGYGDSGESNHWAFIASPVAGSIAPTAVINLEGTQISNEPVLFDYDLYRFNPLANAEWENYNNATHHDGFELVNGMGYLYATKEPKTLVFCGTYNTSVEPMSVTGLPEGFNLVGNPFTVDAYVDKPYYTLNNDGSAIVAKGPNEDQSIPPCHGVIVEVDGSGTVTFGTTTPEPEEAANHGSLQIMLSQALEPVERAGVSASSTTLALDNAIVSFNEGERLGKFYFGKQSANIYLPQGGEEYAIVSVGTDVARNVSTEIPINFKANENGTYTLTVNPVGVEMDYLHLIDNMTGADVDLLAMDGGDAINRINGGDAINRINGGDAINRINGGDAINRINGGDAINRINGGDAKHCVSTYTFEAKTTDLESRFKLVFAANNENGPSTGSGAFAFINNGNIVVNGEGALQVLDVMGRVIRVCTDVARNVSTQGMPAGVYVLRLINGENVRTQKIVIP